MSDLTAIVAKSVTQACADFDNDIDKINPATARGTFHDGEEFVIITNIRGIVGRTFKRVCISLGADSYLVQEAKKRAWNYHG